MQTLAAVFDQQDHLDQAIKALFDAGLPSENVIMLTSGNIQREPSAGMNPGAGRLAAGINQDPADQPAQGGELNNFEIGDDEYEFYRQATQDSETAVVFVKVDSERYNKIRGILENSEVQRVDTLN
jgi:hypothetical protein